MPAEIRHHGCRNRDVTESARLLSTETETMPKVLKSTLSAPKPKRKPKFSRSLLQTKLHRTHRDTRTKALSGDEFRGIAISPVLSKIFENCLLDILKYHVFSLISSTDNQFGFKKGIDARTPFSL